MNAFARTGLVAAGYAGAFLLASAATAVRMAMTSGPEAQASSGMYAFGDSVVFVAVFGLAALLPTAVGLYFLRPYRMFWQALGVLALFVAATGVSAVALFELERQFPGPSVLVIMGAVSVLRILVAPLIAITFMVCGLLSPHRMPRLMLLGAAAAEALVACYGVIVWFVPLWIGS